MTKISNQYSLTNILTADLANSRLGINNVSPTVALDVTGAGKFSSSLNAGNFLSLSAATTLVAPTSGKSLEMVYRLDGANDYAFIQAYDRTNSAMKRLDLNGAVTILGSGNVGIGSTLAGSYYSNKLVVSAVGEDGITIAATTTTTRNFLAFADGTTGEDRYRGLLGYNHTDDSMLFYTNANTRMIISSNGSIGAPSGTNIYNASDFRLKKNISTTTYGLDAISALNPVKFNWVDGFEPTEDGKDMLGFVAQEVQTVIPEAIETFGGNSITIGDTTIDNPLRVNEKFIIPVLVKAIQELSAKVSLLENK
jgi:hypothetical protein